MTTEDKIEEALLTYLDEQNGKPQLATDLFRSGYMACLNSLEPTNLICNTHMLYRLPKGVAK